MGLGEVSLGVSVPFPAPLGKGRDKLSPEKDVCPGPKNTWALT